MLLRALLAAALLVVGAAAALAATLVHQHWWGLLLGLAALASTARALPVGTRRFAFVLGWLTAMGYAVTPRPDGGFLIASSVRGYGLLGGSFVVFLVVLATLPGSRRPPRAGGDDPRVPHG